MRTTGFPARPNRLYTPSALPRGPEEVAPRSGDPGFPEVGVTAPLRPLGPAGRRRQPVPQGSPEAASPDHPGVLRWAR